MSSERGATTTFRSGLQWSGQQRPSAVERRSQRQAEDLREGQQIPACELSLLFLSETSGLYYKYMIVVMIVSDACTMNVSWR